MALLKKSMSSSVTYSVTIPAELQHRIDRVTQAAERRDLVFDLNSTLVRAIKSEVTRAETALGLGAAGRRSKRVDAAPAADAPQPPSLPLS